MMMSFAPVDHWKRIRSVASPAFSTGKLRKMNALIHDCARITSEHLTAAAEKEDDVDIRQFYGHYTLDVIARCAFGTKFDSHTNVANEFVRQARSAFSAKMPWRQLVALLFPALRSHLTVVDSGGPFEYFRSVCQCIISDRRKNVQRQEDFLQLMMDAQDGSLAPTTENLAGKEGELFGIGTEGEPVEPTLPPKRMTEEEAMAQCVLFFIAGQEMTSSTLAFAAYLLAVHPSVQDKLRREADECIATHGSEPSVDVILKLKYLHCVISETLRMYPSEIRLERCTHDDYVLGDTGIKIPKNCTVAIPVYAMHHDPEFFPHPENFNPERFSDENVGSIRPYTYLPFGAGPRSCIGMRLALQAVKLCLLHSLHNVQFVSTAATQVPLKIKKGFGVLTAEDITVRIRRRPSQQS
ncbi:cytochrome P450 3A8-like [Haemaphysalis longicornis]